MVKLFGTTFKETTNALSGGIHLGPQTTKEDKNKAIGRIVVTCLLILLAAFLYTKGDKGTPGTIVGAVIGYWIK